MKRPRNIILINGNRGAALAYVMMVLVVVAMMVSIVAQIAMGNIRQAGGQEDGMQAYYIARSGAELTYEVLLSTTPSLLDEFVADPSKVLLQNDVDFELGTADIRVSSTGSADTQIVTIESIGTLDSSNVTRTVKLDFFIHYDNHPEITWYR